MADLIIKAPDGRIVTCPRHLTRTEGIGTDDPIVIVDGANLKPGWSIYVAPTEAPAPTAPITTTTAPAPVAAALDADAAWKDD